MRRLEAGGSVSSVCGTWTGEWKKSASAFNEVIQGRKHVSLTFVARGMPLEISETRRAVGWIEACRERISSRFEPGDPHGVFRSLLFSQAPDRAMAELWRLLGFVHILTASGIHLYVAARLCHRIAFRVGSACALESSRARSLAFASAAVLCGWVWLLAGARPGMLRPWVVVALRETARYCGVRWRPFAPLAISLGLDLALAALLWMEGDAAAWAPGRLHYAAAVGGGLMGLEAIRTRRGGPLREHVALAVGSWVLTAFLDIAERSSISPWTPLLSLVSIPLIVTFLYPMLLISSLGAWGEWPEWASEALRSTLGAADAVLVESARFLLASSPVWRISLPCALLALALSAAFSRAKSLAWLCVGLIVLRMAPAPAWDRVARGGSSSRAVALQVEQLDIGQGDAALIRGRSWRETGLIDAGSREALTLGAWMGLLSSRGIDRLGFIALSHLDEDHSGGVLRLTALLRVGCVATSRAQWESRKGRALQATLAKRGVRTVEWGDSCFPYPVREIDRDGDPESANGAMSSFWIPLAQGGGYLNLGDADAEAELRALRVWKGVIHAPVILKVSHHGSRTSTSEEFLRRLRPFRAWISAGTGNRHGHPNAEVLQRFPGLRLRVERTDRDGVLDSREDPERL